MLTIEPAGVTVLATDHDRRRRNREGMAIMLEMFDNAAAELSAARSNSPTSVKGIAHLEQPRNATSAVGILPPPINPHRSALRLRATGRVRRSIAPGDVGIVTPGTGPPRQQGGALTSIPKVPLPASDPVFEVHGPLVAVW